VTTVGVIVHTRHYRESLAQSLRATLEWVVVDLGDGEVDTLERLLQLRPQVALLDLKALPLAAFVREVHQTAPTIALVALNQEIDAAGALSLFEAGLTGFVLATAGMDDIQVGIRDALRGELHCPPSIAAALVRRVRGRRPVRVPGRHSDSLTSREEQIVSFLERGYSNKEIATLLGVSLSTVKTHVHHVLAKTGASRRHSSPIDPDETSHARSVFKGRRGFSRR
jgi:DNA-binding NarL/FixJ family response regulator